MRVLYLFSFVAIIALSDDVDQWGLFKGPVITSDDILSRMFQPETDKFLETLKYSQHWVGEVMGFSLKFSFITVSNLNSFKDDYRNYFEWMQLNRVNFIDYDTIARAYAKLMEKSYMGESTSFADLYNLFYQLQYMDKDTQHVDWGQIEYDRFVELIQRIHVAWARYQFEMADLNHD